MSVGLLILSFLVTAYASPAQRQQEFQVPDVCLCGGNLTTTSTLCETRSSRTAEAMLRHCSQAHVKKYSAKTSVVQQGIYEGPLTCQCFSGVVFDTADGIIRLVFDNADGTPGPAKYALFLHDQKPLPAVLDIYSDVEFLYGQHALLVLGANQLHYIARKGGASSGGNQEIWIRASKDAF